MLAVNHSRCYTSLCASHIYFPPKINRELLKHLIMHPFHPISSIRFNVTYVAMFSSIKKTMSFLYYSANRIRVKRTILHDQYLVKGFSHFLPFPLKNSQSIAKEMGCSYTQYHIYNIPCKVPLRKGSIK